MERTYKLMKLVGISHNSYEEAIENAVAAASKTVSRLDWFEVIEQRGKVTDGKIAEFQVIIEAAAKVIQD